MNIKVAVIAGTPVDTQMGVDYLNNKDPEIQTIYLPLENNPRGCHLFQMKTQEEKHSQMKALFLKALDLGADAFFIYCNSLSAAFDFKALAKELNVPCVTPISAYEQLAGNYNCCGLIAANNQATAGIEKAFTIANPDCYILGSGLLFLVEDIEKGFRKESPLYAAESIVERRKLEVLCSFYKNNGAQCLILGCTHFPYLRTALETVTDLPVIDPADIMYSILKEKSEK